MHRMPVLKEFKEFVARGNVVDLAVGVVMGAAFGKIVSSLVGDLIMPPLGLAVGGVNFASLRFVLREPMNNLPAVSINYGAFLQAILDFLIIAVAIFLLVKLVNRLRRQPPPPPSEAPPPSPEVALLTEIRDALVKRPPG
jgi:large conductance mechanosensitive channel